ncbi:MAG: PEGA domain-containing protein [Deltaproteobacteria bacterium]|nr:PEGA domain-containing protein [Deltaproteobacteria bacterium]
MATAIAVLPLRPIGVALTPVQVESATTLLQAESGVRGVPSAELRAAIQQRKAASLGPAFDPRSEIEIGRAVSAQKLLSAAWSRLGASCSLSAQLIDLKTEVAEYGTTAMRECSEAGLADGIREVAVRIRARFERGGAAFQLDLSDAKRVKNPKPDGEGFLTISVEAQDAPDEKVEVWINGERRGYASNKLYTVQLPTGHYIVLLRTAGDLFAHRRIELDLAKQGLRVPSLGVLQLPPAFGSLVLEGTPPIGTLIVDGEPEELRGAQTKKLRYGRHVIGIEAPGFVPWGPRDVDIAPGQERRLSYELERNAGRLLVRGSPVGAAVSIDGASVGRLPLELPEVDTGDHLVEVAALGHHAERRLVRIERGEPSEIELTLTRKIARLRVQAFAKVLGERTPVEAEVLIDGELGCTTPCKKEGVLAEVKHRIELRLAGATGPFREVLLEEGSDQEEMIEAPAEWGGATATLRFDLVPGPWVIRSGSAVLRADRPNQVRPGRVAFDLLLDGQRVAAGEATIPPKGEQLVRVTERPRTLPELESARRANAVRTWIAAGLGGVALALGAQQLGAAHLAAGQRDEAYAALRVAGVAEEVDGYRAAVVDREDARLRSSSVSLVAFGVAAAALIWGLTEWLAGAPLQGTIEGEGVLPVDVGGR